MPHVSIITATLNRLGMLQEAVANVRAQEIASIEHLIVDGGSTDGTLEWVVLQPDLKLVRGPDRGVYDAWNKGIAAADGDVIGFLNSDDLYCAGAISSALRLLSREPRTDAISGPGTLVEGRAEVRRYDKPGEVVQDLRTLFLGHCGINMHFFRRQRLQELGAFSLDYHLVSDRDMMIRFVERGFGTLALGTDVYRYRRHADSMTFDHAMQNEKSLRYELMALAQHWQIITGSSLAARRLARVLEGRSRIGLARLAVRARDRSLVYDALSAGQPNGLGTSVRAVLATGLDYLIRGR